MVIGIFTQLACRGLIMPGDGKLETQALFAYHQNSDARSTWCIDRHGKSRT